MASAAGPDERQARVIEALQGRSRKLAGIYKSALGELASPSAPACEAARVSIVCHCMRELMNGLPSVMADTLIPRPTPPSSSLLAKLPKLLAENPDTNLGLDQDLVPVPRPVAHALDALIATVARERGRNLSNAAALVTGGGDTNHPAIAQWRSAQDFFLDWTHLDRNHNNDRELPSDDELMANIRIVEDVIEVRSGLFFDNLHALDDILAAANAVDEGGE